MMYGCGCNGYRGLKYLYSVEDSIAVEAVKNSGISLMGKSDSPLSEAKGHIMYPLSRKICMFNFHKKW